MKATSVALLIYGDSTSSRNALTEEKYSALAQAFSAQGFTVTSVLYHDADAGRLSSHLLTYDAVLVWINPIEQETDRTVLDSLLRTIAEKGCYVSTHPDTIAAIGTKDVLFTSREMEWGGDTQRYATPEEFVSGFLPTLHRSGIRVLKQHRGNGGNGVFKVLRGPAEGEVTVIHAGNDRELRTYAIHDFFVAMKPFFERNGSLIDQEWNPNFANGMVRCYLSGAAVAGFGYQEINALYPETEDRYSPSRPTSKRFYVSEQCGLFSDLKEKMEHRWVPQLMERHSLSREQLPVIWDADFFINSIHSVNTAEKYTLCEINVSCVSPFPPSAIPYIVNAVRRRLNVSP